MKTLPDLVRPGLKVLFIGTNPGKRSAQIGHYFAGRSNMFWRLLYESSLTRKPLKTELDRGIIRYGYGLTDVVKKPTRSTTELRRNDGKGTKNRLDKVIVKNKPRIVAFIGKTGYRYYLGENLAPLKYGIQDQKIENSKVYLLPSTSGASFADTKYPEKLYWYKRLRLMTKK